jgi:very-short-patch-repair endonuclease
LALATLAARQYGVVSRRQLLALGLKSGAIKRQIESKRLRRVHRGVYASGHQPLDQRARWLAAVLACGEGAVLSHRSAAALWGLSRSGGLRIDVTSPHGRAGRPGVTFHECRLDPEDLTKVHSIPVTSVARTLFDFAEVADFPHLERACEEADRLNLLQMRALERVVERGWGRHALKPIRPIVVEARRPDTTNSPLEDRFLAFCREHGLPKPLTNVVIEGKEVDAFWPAKRLMVELDSWTFHGHRAAFERDRARDTALQVAGHRIIRLTHRRLEQEPETIASEIRAMLD